MTVGDLSNFDDLAEPGEQLTWGARIAWVIQTDGTWELRWDHAGQITRAMAAGGLEAVKLEILLQDDDDPVDP